YGGEVNAASKLGEDTAKAGEILVTGHVKDAVSAMPGLRFDPLGDAPPGADSAFRPGDALPKGGTRGRVRCCRRGNGAASLVFRDHARQVLHARVAAVEGGAVVVGVQRNVAEVHRDVVNLHRAAEPVGLPLVAAVERGQLRFRYAQVEGLPL